MAKENMGIDKWEDVDFTLDAYWRVVITPELAEKILLEMNYKENRTLKRKNETYARIMRDGKWFIGNGEVIKFASDGTLLDGQNRLVAVKKSEASVTIDVKTGLTYEMFDALDSGVSRTDGDALSGKVANAVAAASVSRIAQTLHNGANNMQSHAGINIAPSRQEVVAFAIENDEAIQWGIKQGRRLRDSINVSGVGITGWFVAYWLTYEKDKEAADEFIEQFINGDRAIKSLRADMLMKNDDGKDKSKEWIINRYVDAFNALMLNRDYTYGENRDELIKAYRKLFVEYLENMRAVGSVFEF